MTGHVQTVRLELAQATNRDSVIIGKLSFYGIGRVTIDQDWNLHAAANAFQSCGQIDHRSKRGDFDLMTGPDLTGHRIPRRQPNAHTEIVQPMTGLSRDGF